MGYFFRKKNFLSILKGQAVNVDDHDNSKKIVYFIKKAKSV